MVQLIKIEQLNDMQSVNARELHELLKTGRDFSNWIKDRIETYQFIKDEDFYIIDNQFNRKNQKLQNVDNQNLRQNWRKVGRPTIDYIISTDMAKELCMIENNSMGRKIRKYFIAIEKLARERMVLAPEPISVYGNVCHDYIFWLLQHGYSVSSGSVNSRKRNYPQHFKVHNDRYYISEAFGNALLAYRETKRKVAQVEGLHQTSLELKY